MKTRLIYFTILLLICGKIDAQYIPTTEDILINDVLSTEIEKIKTSSLKSGTASDFYNDLRTWIPYCNSEPLKNPPITYIELTFHVFLDNNGQNNSYLNTQEGRNKLIEVLNTTNRIYSGGWGPSDPVSGVTELPNYDTRIRFTLGENNERIYFYNNTALNHGMCYSTFDNYIQTNYPSRATKLNIYFTAGHYGGKVDQSKLVITNSGSGYTSSPTVTFNIPSSTCFSQSVATGTSEIYYGHLTSINVTNSGFYEGFDPPQITISGGGGSGATAIVSKLVGGATGYIANWPSTTLTRTHHVVMLHCYEASDWIYGMTLAHELGHDLGLSHTYCGGGASPVCCTGSCSQGCTQDCSNDEYLSDIFGSCPGTCPHYGGWYDPTSADPKHTNNVMGGSNSQLYFSPMQAGQMHRTLALYSLRKYVKKETYSTIPLVINSSETWDFNLKLYRDVNILSGAVLTISNTFELPYNGTVTINNGAALVITGTLKLADINKIIVKNGGTIKFSSTSNIQINGSGKIEVQSGGYFCVESGATIALTNFMRWSSHTGQIIIQS